VVEGSVEVKRVKARAEDVLGLLKRYAGERFSARGITDALGNKERERVGGILETLHFLGVVRFDERNRLWFYEGKIGNLPENVQTG
jgi:hypothetical protein